MASQANQEKAVGVLQQLGLKEYEAKCFVALSRMPSGTAKDISEITDVPRTRVYDAIRVLEAQGLVEIQHGSPQQFRAVPIREAIETLRDQYENRVDTLQDALTDIDPVDTEDSEPHEVWALSGAAAIANRTRQLIGDAREEVVLVIGVEELLDDDLVSALNDLDPSDDVILGALGERVEERLQNDVPNAETFVSGLDWLQGGNGGEPNETAIGLLLLVDRETILVSTVDPETGAQQAVFGRGFGNGLVVIARRLMATGLLSSADPGK